MGMINSSTGRSTQYAHHFLDIRESLLMILMESTMVSLHCMKPLLQSIIFLEPYGKYEDQESFTGERFVDSPLLITLRQSNRVLRSRRTLA